NRHYDQGDDPVPAHLLVSVGHSVASLHRLSPGGARRLSSRQANPLPEGNPNCPPCRPTSGCAGRIPNDAKAVFGPRRREASMGLPAGLLLFGCGGPPRALASMPNARKRFIG